MSNETTIRPRLYTVKQIAVYLNFPAPTVYALVNKNEIPFKRIGNKSIRFDIYQIDSNGSGSWILPNTQMRDSHKLHVQDYWFPSRSGSFILDENIGIETIYVVVTQAPAEDLESMFDSGVTTDSQVIAYNIQTRGVATARKNTGAIESMISIPVTKELMSSRIKTISKKPLQHNAGVVEAIRDKNDFFVALSFRHK